MNGKRKSNIPIRIAGILLCVVLFTSHLVSGMFAKYVTGSSNLGDTAGTASVDLSVTHSAAADSDDGYVFTVKNDSEVSFAYDVIVTFADPAQGFDVTKVFNADSVMIGTSSFSAKSADGKVFTFADYGTIEPGAASDLVLSFEALPVYMNVDDTLNKLSLYNGGFPFTVSVRAEQID